MKEPRPYQGESDLAAMRQLLVDGRQANNGSYYIHTGDLSWWLYYPPLDGDFWDQIYLWDDPWQPGRILGWALFSPGWVGLDVYIQPGLRGSELAWEIYAWGEQHALKIARENNRPTIYTLWVLHSDVVLGGYLKQRGFRLGRGYVHLTRSLDEEIPAAPLPDGFSASTVDIAEVGARKLQGIRFFCSFEPTWSASGASCIPAYNLGWISWQPPRWQVWGCHCLARPVTRVAYSAVGTTRLSAQGWEGGHAGLRQLQQEVNRAIVSTDEIIPLQRSVNQLASSGRPSEDL
jgi:hypothetical protein